MAGIINTSTISNPNSSELCLKRTPMEAFCRFPSLPRPRSSSVLTLAVSVSGYPRGIGRGLLLRRSNTRNRSIFSFAASQEDSASDVEIDEEETSEKAEETWKRTLVSFKEQALKMLKISPEDYKAYLKKGTVAVKETSEQLKIRADKASEDMSVIVKELSEEGKEFLSAAAENSPEPVKDIVDTFAAASSSDDLKDVSKVLDFYVGIPYGGVLALGGFLSFMVTGSTSAIRFGVILGGTLLGLAVYSLRSWKRGESSPAALKGQAAIATILFLRDLRLVFSRPAFTRYISLIISGGALAFYIYRISHSRGQSTQGSSFGTETEI